MAEKILVTRAGYEKLLAERQNLYDQLRNIQGQKGEAADVGGNAWHDNFSFEELVRQETMTNASIGLLQKKMAEMTMVDKPRGNDILQIGHHAVITFEDGEERTYEIAGYGESNLDSQPPKLEYLAPIIRPFFAKEIGTEAKITIQGVARSAELTAIKMPET